MYTFYCCSTLSYLYVNIYRSALNLQSRLPSLQSPNIPFLDLNVKCWFYFYCIIIHFALLKHHRCLDIDPSRCKCISMEGFVMNLLLTQCGVKSIVALDLKYLDAFYFDYIQYISLLSNYIMIWRSLP